MRKIHIVGLALFAVFAFSAYAVASASALESVWLVNNAKPAAKVLVDSEGEMLLADLKTPIGEIMLLCSGLGEGFVGGDATGNNPTWDEVTKITGLNPVTEPEFVLCTTQTGCESSTSPEARAVHLPWLTELLLELGVYIDDILGTGGEPGWLVRHCLVLGLEQAEDECVKNSAADPENLAAEGENPADVVALFSEAISGHASCSVGGSEAGDAEGEVLILVPGGSLAVSEA